MIDRLTTTELDLYRRCPIQYYIQKRDKEFRRFDDSNPYYDSIIAAINSIIKLVFINNSEPKEKVFLKMVIDNFYVFSQLTAEEQFLNGMKTNKLVQLAKKVFNSLMPVFSNIIVHPVLFDIFVGNGDTILEGYAHPIALVNKVPTVMIFGTNTHLSRQTQFTDINMSAYKLWLYDNFTDVKTFGVFNLKNLAKGVVQQPINFKDIHIAMKYLSNLANSLKAGNMYPAHECVCATCAGDCVDYLIREL